MTKIHPNGAVEVTRLFTEAFNARDRETLGVLTAEDAEFPTPEGRALRGEEGLQAIVGAATESDLILARTGHEEAEEEEGPVQRLAVPVREVFHTGGELRGTARFTVRDGRVAAFEVGTRD
jgi:hypothetical protein